MAFGISGACRFLQNMLKTRCFCFPPGFNTTERNLPDLPVFFLLPGAVADAVAGAVFGVAEQLTRRRAIFFSIGGGVCLDFLLSAGCFCSCFLYLTIFFSFFK